MSQWGYVAAAYVAAALILGGVTVISALDFAAQRRRMKRLGSASHGGGSDRDGRDNVSAAAAPTAPPAAAARRLHRARAALRGELALGRRLAPALRVHRPSCARARSRGAAGPRGCGRAHGARTGERGAARGQGHAREHIRVLVRPLRGGAPVPARTRQGSSHPARGRQYKDLPENARRFLGARGTRMPRSAWTPPDATASNGASTACPRRSWSAGRRGALQAGRAGDGGEPADAARGNRQGGALRLHSGVSSRSEPSPAARAAG